MNTFTGCLSLISPEMRFYPIRILLLLAWMALIFLLSANPNPYASVAGTDPAKEAPPLVAFLSNDLLGEIGHLGEYIVLGLLAAWAFLPPQATSRVILAVIGFCMLYAISDEIHQIFVPWRSFQIVDLLLDGAGILLGLRLYRTLHRWQVSLSV